MKVLLGVTGSVATVLVEKLGKSLLEQGHELQVIMTEKAKNFYSPDGSHFDPVELRRNEPWFARLTEWERVQFWDDDTEWNNYDKGDPVVHIELRKWADVFLVAPLSANTLAKFANGLCDNLLTSVFRAWDFDKPVVLAPAMNTYMWTSPFTQKHLGELKLLRTMTLGTIRIVPPQEKMLACGDEGIGAMADISTIIEAVNKLDKTKTAEVAASPST